MAHLRGIEPLDWPSYPPSRQARQHCGSSPPECLMVFSRVVSVRARILLLPL
ncbi:MAG: hypothetical protein ACFCU9_09640 [Cyanophyceae cyanobacterium]